MRSTATSVAFSGDESVVVIGAGIAGLSAAWAAQRAGAHVVVLEADTRVGGVIVSERRGGFLLELGPNSAMNTPELTRLIAELGLGAERVSPAAAAHRRYAVRDGRMVEVPTTPPKVLGSAILSPIGKLRALAELFVPRADVDAPEESVGAFARRRFGREAAEYLIDPMVSGIYAADPDRISSRHTLRVLRDLEQRDGSVIRGAIRSARERQRAVANGGGDGGRAMFSFRDGLAQLPLALAAALGDAVQLRTRVRAIDHDGARWIVDCEGEDGLHRHFARAVVITVPAHAVATIEMPAVLREMIAPIDRVRAASVATLALGFDRADIAHPLDGFGVLAPHIEHTGILGALFISSIFEARAPDGSALITCMIGGAREPAAVLDTDTTMVQRALGALNPLLGITGAPAFVRATRWEHAIPQYELGHDQVLAAAVVAEQEFPGLVLAGSYRDGVAIGDRVASGLRAGARAAGYGAVALEAPQVG